MQTFEDVCSELDALSTLVLSLLNTQTSSAVVGHDLLQTLNRQSFNRQSFNRQNLNLLTEDAKQTTDASVQKQSLNRAVAPAEADQSVSDRLSPSEILLRLQKTRELLTEALGTAVAGRTHRHDDQLADSVFENTPHGVLVMRDELCVACNQSAADLLGDRGQVINTWPLLLQGALLEDGCCCHAELKRRYHRALQGQSSVTEISLPADAASTTWFEVSMRRFHLEDVAHVLLTLHDVTSRKRIEHKLRQHRDFLNNVINAIPDPLLVRSSRQTPAIANDAFCDSFGFAAEQIPEAASQAVSGAIHAADGAIQAVDGSIHDSRPETEVLLRSGERRIFSTKRNTFCDPQTGETFVVAASRDITEQRCREHHLHLLASVFHDAGEAVAILTRDGRIVEANAHFLRMANANRNRVLNHSLASVLGFHLPSFVNDLARISPGQPWSGKLQVKQRAGEKGERWYWATISLSDQPAGAGVRLIALFSDVSALEQSQQQLEKEALYDNLTGLPNRRFFRRYMAELISESAAGTNFAVCFLDLDNFKLVNDSQGHSAGDRLLKMAADRLTRSVGGKAFVARFGGDEFAVILSDIDPACRRVATATDEILQAFHEPFFPGNAEAVVGVSMGVALYPDHALDAESLLQNADIAMYAAKAAGKNSIRLFTSGMKDIANARNKIQNELRRSLSGGDISLHFQPRICARTGRMAGCESLARWQRPDGTSVSPLEFIPIAEESGLIIPLGELVLTRTCECCRIWADAGLNPFPVAVNVSPQQLRHPAFVERVRQILAETNARPEWIELEITEDAIVEDLARAERTVQGLREIGVKTAIDDFGTGRSALNYLQSLPIHSLKIDASFIRNLTVSRNSAAIASAIVSLGNGMGLTVVAEGIEQVQQAQQLREMGCDVFQGYLFSRPLSTDAFREWLLQGNHGTAFLQQLLQTSTPGDVTKPCDPSFDPSRA